MPVHGRASAWLEETFAGSSAGMHILLPVHMLIATAVLAEVGLRIDSLLKTNDACVPLASIKGQFVRKKL